MLETDTLFPDTLDIETLLKGNDIARILNISRSFAYLLMQSGDIPVVRVGHSVRVRPSDLRSFIMKNSSGETNKDRSSGPDLLID
jgi:excisionase family DNA binding protein